MPEDICHGERCRSIGHCYEPRYSISRGTCRRPFRSANRPGWQILHTPGHTPGHVSFFRPSDRTLLVGDAFCTTKPKSFFEAAVVQHAELHGPPSYFTSDWDAARNSVKRRAALEPIVLEPGHGDLCLVTMLHRPYASYQLTLTKLPSPQTSVSNNEGQSSRGRPISTVL